MERIAVLGGSGAVGREVCAALVQHVPGQVAAVGRDPAKLRAVPGVHALPADIGREDGLARAIRGADAVIVCTERGGERVARACLAQGTHYVDVSASAPRLRAIAALDGLARTRGAAAVLSVGLAPGVTNLLARSVTDAGGTGRLRIGVLLGGGEVHGAEALDWTLNGLDGAGRPLRSRFPQPYGRRTAYGFPFSDQYTLPETLGAEAVATGLCLDSRAATLLLGAARLPAVARRLRRPRVRGALRKVLSRVHVGGDGFAVSVIRGSAAAWFGGRGQSRATGVVAALLALRLPGLPPGVRHIEQAVGPGEFLREVAAHGFGAGIPEASGREGAHYDAQ
ncbi:saccharopine dehydrogenase family protein [Streptomonospora alba]|uniref:saccharopine dehydrogenase family protein n=1 Tax=Streptomonospora alba TaxID=183763 RepID=UPI00069B26B4|nr:saccharopine dehydrogenase NADP-binding domain-containing protein [Streptomonospora alba]